MLMNHVKLVIENSPEEKALVLEETEGTTVESLIRLAISKAKWKDRRLTLLTAKLYIAEATQFNAITQPLNDMAVSHLQKFEIRLRDEEIATTCSINVDVTINGTTQANQQFELSDNANVQDLIMAILDKIRRNEGNSMIDSVRIFYSEFDEWADVIEPYSNEAIKFDRKYSVVINCKEPEIPPNANSSEKSDQVNSPRTFVMSNSSPAAESGQRDMAHTKPSPTQSSIAIASNQSDLTFAQIPQGETITRQALGQMVEPEQFYDAHSKKPDQVSSPRTATMLNSSPAAESGQCDMANTKPSPTQSSTATEPIVEIESNQNNSTFVQIPQGETITRQALGQMVEPEQFYDAHSKKPDQVSSPRTATMLNSSPAAESGQCDMAHTKSSPTQPSIATEPIVEIESNQNNSTFVQIPQEGAITRRALGRIAQLGDLYDAYTDCFCGRALFNGHLPKNAIKLNNTPNTAYKYVIKDSINDKFNKLGVEAELKASMLGGMIQVSGHGNYLSINSSTARETSATLVCKMTTKNEAIKIDNKEVVSLLSPNAVRSTPNATHVVVAIQWGAVAIATLKCNNEENEDKTEVEEAIQAKLACLRIDGAGQGSVNNILTRKSRDFRLEFFIDALSNGDNIPQTVEEAVSFIKKLPALVANANGGKDKPICYTLLPLSAFKHYLGAIDSLNQVIKPIDENAIEKAVHIFDEMNQSQRELNDIHDDFKKYSFCITDDDVQRVVKLLQSIKTAQTSIREQLHKAIVDIRHGRSDVQAIFSIIDYYNNQPASRAAVDDFINSLIPLREKIDYVADIQKKGAHYIGKGVSLKSKQREHNSNECYIFFCSWSQPQGLAENKRYFNSLIEEKKFTCFLVDIDSQPDISQREGVGDGNRICLFNNGEYISNDCFGDYLEDRKKCLVKCTRQRTKTTTKSNKRVDFDLICPQSLKGQYCSDKVKEWFCADCGERLQYDSKGSNHNFLCECGSAPINTFQFRCSDPEHGTNFIGFSDNKHLTNLVKQLRPKEINILILGETGVGKSTWINGFANYLTFQTLKEAEKGRQIYLVPSKFTITDSNGMMKDIQVGKAENESFDVGASSTQKPRSYVFNVGKKTIRLIDTPGIGDCRGADQDALNFSSILQYIAPIAEIHGICILLKPNNSRMNIVFKYCINELLTHLHVSAAQNIAFCFTNARGTFYRPGDTLPVLMKFLGDLKANRGVEISLSKGTTYYCMDNESFRFLCCLHEGEKFAEEEHNNFEQSWTLAVRETEILLNHFENDVDPHIVGQTVSLNEARTLILTLAKPLADISQIIQDNISEVNMKKDMITKLDARNIDLEKDLMIPQIGIKAEPLDYPRTACTGINCVDIQRLPNSNAKMTIYKTICHDHCYLDGIVPETCPNVDLQKCKAMNPSTLNCMKCGCSWDVHIHIKFEQKKVKVMVEDPVTKQALQKNLSSKEKQKILIQSLNDRVEKYREEQKTIDKICAKFGAFLKENSIVPYNDTIEDYLKFNIGELKRQGNNTKSPETLQNVERLEMQLRLYQETKRLLDQKMESGHAKKVEATEIKQMQRQLEQLELTGKDIKKLFDATVCGQQTNFCYTETYFDDSQYRRNKSLFSKAKDWALGGNR